MELPSTAAAVRAPSAVALGDLPRSESPDPRQHRLRRQGAARCCSPVPANRARLRDGAARRGADVEERFFQSVVASPAFDPLRDRRGDKEALEAFLREKWRPSRRRLRPNLGKFDEEARRGRRPRRDRQFVGAGHVQSVARDGDPHQRRGAEERLDVAKRMKRAALVHTTTCFVAGNRSGEVWEDEALVGYFPRPRGAAGEASSPARRRRSTPSVDAERIRQVKPTRPGAGGAGSSPATDGARRSAMPTTIDAEDRGGPLAQEVGPGRDDQARHRPRRATGAGPTPTRTRRAGRPAGRAAAGNVRASCVRQSSRAPSPIPSAGGTKASPPRRRWSIWRSRGRTLPVGAQADPRRRPVDHVVSGMMMVAAAAIVEQPKLVSSCRAATSTRCTWSAASRSGLYKRSASGTRRPGTSSSTSCGRKVPPGREREYERYSIPLTEHGARKASQRSAASGRGGARGASRRSIDHVSRTREISASPTRRPRTSSSSGPSSTRTGYIFRADNIRALRVG